MEFEMTAKVKLDDERVIALVIDLIGELLKEEMDCEIIDFSTLNEIYRRELINRCISYEIEGLFEEPVSNDCLEDIELIFNDDVMKLEEICAYYYDRIVEKLDEICG